MHRDSLTKSPENDTQAHQQLPESAISLRIASEMLHDLDAEPGRFRATLCDQQDSIDDFAAGQFQMPEHLSMDDEAPLTFGEMWEPINRTITLGDIAEVDYFEEAVKDILEGNVTHSFFPASTDELPMGFDNETADPEEFGIQVPGKFNSCKNVIHHR